MKNNWNMIKKLSLCCVFMWLFDMCSCVVCFSMIFLCVHVRCVFLLFSRVFMCGYVWCVFFNDFLVRVHVWCVFLLFSGGQKKTYYSFGGGQICYKYVPSTCYIFLRPHHPKKKKANDASDGGGSNLLNIRPQHLLFSPPPPAMYQTLTVTMVYIEKTLL